MLIERLLKFPADKGELEIEIVSMTRFQVMKQSGYRNLLVVLKLSAPINGKVHNSQKGIGINIIVLTGFFDSLVSKAQIDAKTAQCLQQVVIVADERYHLIIRLIHLLILHLYTLNSKLPRSDYRVQN